jgi:Transmembrane domain of unknown function (DUF3566)
MTDDQETRPTGLMALPVRPRPAAADTSAAKAGDAQVNGGPPAVDNGKDGPGSTIAGATVAGATVAETAVAEAVPALPADTIGSPGNSSAFSFSRPAAAPVSPGPDDWALPGADDWTLEDSGGSSPDEPVDADVSAAAAPDAAPTAEASSGQAPAAGAPAADPPAVPAGAGTSTAEAPPVSAAAFTWQAPDPPPSSPSAARTFLRSAGSPNTPAGPPPAASTVGSATARPRSAPPQGPAKRSARQAHLTIARVEPWSVMKFSFVVAVVAFVILFVAVSVLYGALSGLGVFDSLQKVVSNVTSSQGSAGVNAARWFSASRILGYTALLGSLNIVLITAMSTIGAVVYNLTSRLVGGIEVTLRETE